MYKVIGEYQKALYVDGSGVITDWYDDIIMLHDYYFIACKDEKCALFSLIQHLDDPISQWWDDLFMRKKCNKYYAAGRIRRSYFDREYAIFRIDDPENPVSGWVDMIEAKVLLYKLCENA